MMSTKVQLVALQFVHGYDWSVVSIMQETCAPDLENQLFRASDVGTVLDAYQHHLASDTTPSRNANSTDWNPNFMELLYPDVSQELLCTCKPDVTFLTSTIVR